MSPDEHRNCQENLAAYVVDALLAHEREAVSRHLEVCAICAEDAAAFQQATSRLAEEVPIVEPPAELRDRIMSVVSAEAELLRGPTRAPGRRRSRAAAWAPRALAATAFVAAGLAVGIALPGTGGGGTRTVPATAGVAARQVALELHGQRGTLVVRNLMPPRAGRVYEAWVQRGSAAPQPAGALFVVRSGRVELPVALRAGDRVMLSEEPRGGSPQPTSAPVVVTQRI